MTRLLAFVLLVVVLWGRQAMATEEPSHTVALHEGSFELRDYPARVVAEVSVTGTQFQAGGSGFRLLADYIFGGNASQRHIAMTAPVAQFRHSADSAPNTDAQVWTVQFFMPNGASLATLPLPNNAQVRLMTLPPQRLAVLRYTGWSTAAAFAHRSAALLAECTAHHLRPAGPVTLAQYNPPWTPWFMRRNEVMVVIAP